MKNIGKWKWLILLFLGVGLAIAGAAFHEHIWGILLMVLGIYGSGYACGRMDEILGPMTIQIGIRERKPYIRYIKEK